MRCRYLVSAFRYLNLWKIRHNPTMKHKLSTLGASLLATVCILSFVVWNENKAPAQTPARTEPSPDASLVETAVDGQQLVADAAKNLDDAESISAKIRQTGVILNRPLEGYGLYLQSGLGNERLLRLELKLSVGSTSTSMVQVCNEESLWLRRDVGGEATVTRVKLGEVRKAEAQAGIRTTEPNTSLLSRGGLPILMKSLDDHFIFASPKSSSILDTPVWELEGHWKPDTLRRLLPSQEDAIEKKGEIDYEQLAPNVPARVRIVLGREGMAKMFPFRIEYFRSPVPVEEEEPMIRIEFFEVRRGVAIDSRLFRYKPEENVMNEIEDITDKYMAEHKLKRAR